MRATGLRLPLVLLALLAACEDAPRGVNAKRAQELYAQARAALTEERWLDAAALFRQGIESGPYDEGARYTLGTVLVQHATTDEVVKYYSETVAADPKPQTSHYFWALALEKAGDREGALEHFGRAIEIDPAHELSQLAWGELLEREGDLRGALAHFERAVYIHPEFVDALRACARAHTRLGDEGKAADFRQRAQQANQDTPMRFVYWARVLLEEGRVEAAIAELENAVEAMPRNEDARRLLAEARARP